MARVSVHLHLFLLIISLLSKPSAGGLRSGMPMSVALTQSGGIVNQVDSKTLTFSPGDVIDCEIVIVANHFLLATSSSTVAHIVLTGNKNEGRLQEDSWNTIAEKYKECRVVDFEVGMKDRYGRKTTPYSTNEAIRRARKDIQDKGVVYYDVRNCNCEHWVNWWKWGKAWSFQIGGTNSKCQIK